MIKPYLPTLFCKPMLQETKVLFCLALAGMMKLGTKSVVLTLTFLQDHKNSGNFTKMGPIVFI